jgi:hypothetical protein
LAFIVKDGKVLKDLNISPFEEQNYSVFGFLANVRNYSKSPVISEPRGLPDFVKERAPVDWYNQPSYSEFGEHSFSWLSVKELNDFNYDQEFEDLRNSSKQLEVGFGIQTTLREFLGIRFFRDLEELNILGATHVVFGFSS